MAEKLEGGLLSFYGCETSYELFVTPYARGLTNGPASTIKPSHIHVTLFHDRMQNKATQTANNDSMAPNSICLVQVARANFATIGHFKSGKCT